MWVTLEKSRIVDQANADVDSRSTGPTPFLKPQIARYILRTPLSHHPLAEHVILAPLSHEKNENIDITFPKTTQ